MSQYHIAEGVSGTWYYNLSDVSTNATALCGAKTMNTSILMKCWGVRGHLNERRCATCVENGATTLAAVGVTVVTQA